VWSQIGLFIKIFALIILTLVFKVLAALALLIMGLYFVLVTQMGSFLLAIAFILGPLLVPWYILPATEFLFTGWLKFTIVAGLYKVVAWTLVAIVLNGLLPAVTIIIQAVSDSSGAVSDDYYSTAYIAYMAVAFVCFVGAYMMVQAPSIANSLVSGHPSISPGGFGRGVVGSQLKSIPGDAGSAIKGMPEAIRNLKK
jgi:type IV secretory pathway VirB6-like protein